MSRITLNKITQITGNPASAISAINNNFETLEKAIDDTLSRTGQAPTYMASALDMNSKRIINLPAPVDDNDAVRKIDIAGSSESAQQYAQQAAASAATAAVSAGEASASATSAATSASTASGVLTDAGFVAVSTDLASSDSKIKAVANNKTNIDNVATNITTVAGVGEHITDVTTVSTNMSAVTAVSGNTTNINTVATNIDNVNAVGGAIADVTSVAGDLANIDAVAGNSTNINTVATNITNINTVAGEKDNIDTIVADKTNIDAVAGNKTNIDTVAGDSTNIGKVATDITNVNTVANNIANVNTVATNISDVNTCSTNIDAIKNAPNHAANAKIWAIGDPSEPTEHSAKWWSQHAGFVNKGDYSATTTYGTNDLVKVETSTQTIFYASLQDANTGHAVTETSWWQEMWKVDKGVVEGANKDLSNLTATGEAHFVKPTDLATRDNVGLVKPDSTTITIDSEGKLTAVVTGADVDLSNLSTTGEAKFVKPDAKATTSSLGLVKPDGTSILVSDEGVIAAPLQGADKDLSNLTTTGNAKFSKVSVASTGTATDVIKYITIDGTEKKLGGSEEDNLSITKNASDKIQAVGVISANDVTKAVKTWWGTEVSYAEIGTYYAYISGASSDKYYVRKKTPTTADTVYTGIGVTSSLTITAVGTGTITLSDGDVYTYTESENLTDSTQYDEDTEYHITDDYIAPENWALANATNFTTVGKNTLSGLSMPSSRYDDLTLGASGTSYTAPANGWFLIDIRMNAGGSSDNPKWLSLGINHLYGRAILNNQTSAGQLIDTLACRKGDILTAAYSLAGTTINSCAFRFIYAEGAS